MAAPPFPFLSSRPISVHATTPTTPAVVVPPPPPRHSVYSSDPRAHLISANNTQVYSSSSPATNNNNILPPINTSPSAQFTDNLSTSVNGRYPANSMLMSPRHHSAIRPRLEMRRSSEPNYHVTEYNAIDRHPLPHSSYNSPTTMNGFPFEREQQRQQSPINLPKKLDHMKLTAFPPNKQINRISTLSKILRDDEFAKDGRSMRSINGKRPRFGDRRENGDRDSEDCDSSSSNGYTDR
ncbi:16904_t:CDS:1 [Acaulospora colombiana]|uniref:16904_t:CDS:1 n=1 Tax=Acaulospora colombiana TaxID=27376 RepID=A0ACA9K9M2_9GLOM|nr:16904_t:CDS:1 [Acaulospora colombiana]